MSELIKRVLLVDESTQDIDERFNALEQTNPKRLKTLNGVCVRLSLVDQIRGLSFLGNNQVEKENYLYQIDRLSAYLTTTCIDVITNERFQDYYQWLKEAHKSKSLDSIWNEAFTELAQNPTPEETANAFVKWTEFLHSTGYRETTSIRKAFKNFISMREDWLKDWVLQNYIVEEINSHFKLKKSWHVLSDDEKCRNIAQYLYSLRNLYTHTVTDYQAMESVQRHNSILPKKYQVKGFFAISFPPSSKGEPYRRISLPEDKRESDMIRLLVITWIRKYWLEIRTDSSNFIQIYWDNRTIQ